jgi:hypothetical protein
MHLVGRLYYSSTEVYKFRAPDFCGDYIFLQWLLIFVGFRYGTCFILTFWLLEVEVALN